MSGGRCKTSVANICRPVIFWVNGTGYRSKQLRRDVNSSFAEILINSRVIGVWSIHERSVEVLCSVAIMGFVGTITVITSIIIIIVVVTGPPLPKLGVLFSNVSSAVLDVVIGSSKFGRIPYGCSMWRLATLAARCQLTP